MKLITLAPAILGGSTVFAGSRVPLATLFANLADGLSLEGILEAYPTLKRERAVEALLRAGRLQEAAQ
jgi:uncharacterized protein (DUF433 family)